MKDPTLISRKSLLYTAIAVILLFAAGVALATCGNGAQAAEPKADVYLGPALNIADQVDPGFALTILPRAQPFIFTLDASVMRIDGRAGEAPFRVNCRDYLVPYSIDGRTTGRVAFAFQFHLQPPR